MRIKDIIAHLFDYHIMDKKNWMLEQLVAWVETVEPKEDQAEVSLRAAVQREGISVVRTRETEAGGPGG